jgi:di/tricarboxylate transporter
MEPLLVLAVLAGAVYLFSTEKLPVDLVALLVLASLLVLGLVTPAEALSGFSSEATITVAAMFVLSAGLQASGALHALGRLLAKVRWPWLFLLVLMLVVGPISAFVNNTAAVAVFLPIVLAAAAASRQSPSQLLIPLSYAAQMGGVCTLIGTSTNLLVNSLARDLGHPGFGLFDFAPVGLVTMGVGFVYILAFRRWLLPHHAPAQGLTDAYELGKYLTELRVMPGSRLLGRSVAEARLGEKHGVFVLELLRGEEHVWAPRAERVREGDVLLVRGDWSKLSALKDDLGLEIDPEFTLSDQSFSAGDGDGDGRAFAELMVAPNSRFVGATIASLDFHWHYNATVLAMQRRGEVLRESLKQVELQVGDILLVLAAPDEIAQLRRNPNVVVLSEREREQVSRRKVVLSLAIMAAAIGVAALGWLPIVASALLGCIALVALRVLMPEEAYGAIDWRVIMLLAGVIPLGIAMQKSGLAGVLAGGVVELIGPFGPLAVLAGIYLVTAVLTELMSNNATAVLLTPIAFSTAVSMELSPTPFIVAVLFAASTSFATPVGYQTNTMVYGPGGYRFADYLRFGIPLNLLFWVIAVLAIPVFFPFHP